MADLLTHNILQDTAQPQRLVVMLHGIGQHHGYMEEAARQLMQRMPRTAVVIPDAPLKMHYTAEKVARVREKYDPGFDGDKARSWFRTDMSGWPVMSLRLAFNSLPVVHKVNQLADHYRDAFGLRGSDIAFFGLSQGGAIALYASMARDEACAGVVCHSGMYFGFAKPKTKPGVLMITGEKDDYLCDNRSPLKGFFVSPENSLRRLKERGVPVTEIWCPDLGHEMNGESIAKAADFLAAAFAGWGKDNSISSGARPFAAVSTI